MLVRCVDGPGDGRLIPVADGATTFVLPELKPMPGVVPPTGPPTNEIYNSVLYYVHKFHIEGTTVFFGYPHLHELASLIDTLWDSHAKLTRHEQRFGPLP